MNAVQCVVCVIFLWWDATVTGQWDRVHQGNGVAPSPRCESGLGYDSTSNVIVMYGGRNCSSTNNIFSDTWIYTISTNTWKVLNLVHYPPARYSFVFGSSNGYFYIALGEGPSKFFFNDIWRFNFRTMLWQLLPPQKKPPYLSADQWENNVDDRLVAPDARYGSAGGIFPGSKHFYISLGFSTRRYFDTWKYDTEDMRWIIVDDHSHPYSPNYPHARCLHSGTMVAPEELVIYGGCLSGGKTGGPCPASDSWLFKNNEKDWYLLPSCASPRMKSSMAMLPVRNGVRRAIMYGGIEETSQVLMNVKYKEFEVAVLNPDNMKWVLKRQHSNTGSDLLPHKRHSMCMATGKMGVYMFSGMSLESKKANNELWVLHTNSTDIDNMDNAAECGLPFFSYITLHGILMTLAWGFFLPWGMFIARYMRHRDPLWFNMHRVFQVFGIMVAIAGLVCAILSVKSHHFQFAHAVLGLAVMVLGVQQPLNACFSPCRPHKPNTGKLKSYRRTCWEVWHRVSGRLAILGGVVNISLGVFIGLASMLIWGLWYGYLCLLVLCFIIGEMTKESRHRLDKRSTVKRASKGNQSVFINQGMDMKNA